MESACVCGVITANLVIRSVMILRIVVGMVYALQKVSELERGNKN